MTSFPKAVSFSELMETSCPQHGTSAWLCISAHWRPSTRDLDPTLSPKPSNHLLSQWKGRLHRLPPQIPPSLAEPALGSVPTPRPAVGQPWVWLAWVLGSRQCQALLLQSPRLRFGWLLTSTLLALAPACVPHRPSYPRAHFSLSMGTCSSSVGPSRVLLVRTGWDMFTGKCM